MKAMPVGFPNPIATGVMVPFVRLMVPTNQMITIHPRSHTNIAAELRKRYEAVRDRLPFRRCSTARR
jgi:hypothetical protein